MTLVYGHFISAAPSPLVVIVVPEQTMAFLPALREKPPMATSNNSDYSTCNFPYKIHGHSLPILGHVASSVGVHITTA